MSIPVAQALVLLVPVLLLLPPDLLVPQGDVPATHTAHNSSLQEERRGNLSAWSFLGITSHWSLWLGISTVADGTDSLAVCVLTGGLALPTSARAQQPILQEQPLLPPPHSTALQTIVGWRGLRGILKPIPFHPLPWPGTRSTIPGYSTQPGL